MHEAFYTIVETYCFKRAKKRLLRQSEGDVMCPFIVPFTADGKAMGDLQMPWHDQMSKEIFIGCAGAFMVEMLKDVEAYGVVSEAWAASVAKDEDWQNPTVMPRDHPERVNVLSLYAEDRTGDARSTAWRLDRNERGRYASFTKMGGSTMMDRLVSPTFGGLLVDPTKVN
jgi:hypothetical protein